MDLQICSSLLKFLTLLTTFFFKFCLFDQAGWNRRNIPNSLADGIYFAARRDHRHCFLKIYVILVSTSVWVQRDYFKTADDGISFNLYLPKVWDCDPLVCDTASNMIFYFLESGEETVSIGIAVSNGPNVQKQLKARMRLRHGALKLKI